VSSRSAFKQSSSARFKKARSNWSVRRATEKVDVGAIVASTNRDLAAEVALGAFAKISFTDSPSSSSWFEAFRIDARTSVFSRRICAAVWR